MMEGYADIHQIELSIECVCAMVRYGEIFSFPFF